MSNALIKPKSFKDLVQSQPVKDRLKEVIGERGQQFAVALNQIVSGSYQLQQCEPASILGAAMTAASLDLSCDPNLGEAHLVPYGDKCQLQIGYKGFIQLAMRSGQYKSLGSCVVYEGEFQSYDDLTGELVINKDKSNQETDRKVVGYAAKFKLLNGFERAEYWTAEEIERHAQKYSKAYRFAKGKPDKEKNCLWVTDRDKMALKTVEKALLAHYGPKSIQMQKALKVDGAAVVDVDSEKVEYLDSDAQKEKMVSPQIPETATTPEPEAPSAPAAEVKPEPAKSSGINKVKAIKGFLTNAGLKEDKLIAFLKAIGNIDEDVTTLEEVSLRSPEVIELVYNSHEDIINRIKNA